MRTFLLVFSLAAVSAQAVTFEETAIAALERGLPGRFFLDIRKDYGKGWIRIEGSDWARYYPSQNLIQVPLSMIRRSPKEWSALEWSQFYNELFHAWWDEVFQKRSLYENDRTYLRARLFRYESTGDSRLAQEEGLSETVASVILLVANHIPIERLVYKKDWSVSAVSHSEGLAKFHASAEEIYPSPGEYELLLKWLFGTAVKPTTDLE